MKKLVLLTIVTAIAFCIYSCKNEEKKDGNENKAASNETKAASNETKEIVSESTNDAMNLINAKKELTKLLNEAAADKEITKEEAEKINTAYCEYQSIDAENKTKYNDKKEELEMYFATIKGDKTTEEEYTKSLSLAKEIDDSSRIALSVK